MRLVDQIRTQGYVVVRGLLKPAEIQQARELLCKHFSRGGRPEGLGLHQPDAAIAIGALSWLIAHPAIVQVFAELFDAQMPVFTGNCDAHQNMLSWWHKDTGSSYRTWGSESFFDNSISPVCRAGVYLQNHLERDGLTIREASHRIRFKEAGAARYLPTQAGDVIFFDIRLTHAGQMADRFESLLLRFSRNRMTATASTAAKRLYWWWNHKPSKYSVFFTYGSPSPITQKFIDFEISQRAIRSPGLNQHLSWEFERLLVESGATTEI